MIKVWFKNINRNIKLKRKKNNFSIFVLVLPPGRNALSSIAIWPVAETAERLIVQYWKTNMSIPYQVELLSLSMCHPGPSTYIMFPSTQSDNYLCYNKNFPLLPTKHGIYIYQLNKSINKWSERVLKYSVRIFHAFILYVLGSRHLSLRLEMIRLILLHSEASLHVASHFQPCKISGRAHENLKHWFALLDQSNY